jgi:tetratricopeptide (TPR) repeat protein
MRIVNRLILNICLCAALVSSAIAADVPAAELWNSGRVDDTIRSLNAEVARGQNAEAYAMLSRVYYTLDDYDTAVKNAAKAVEIKPNEATYHFLLGRAYGQKADQAGALSAMSLAKKAAGEFEKALQLDPGDKAARRALAEFYTEAPGFMGGGRDKARKLADQSMTSDPSTANWILGLVANKEKQWVEAENRFKASVKASGGAASDWIELAHFYAWGKRWNEFESAMGSALSSNKKNPADLVNASELLIGTGRNFPAAAQALKTYLASPKKDEDYPAFRAHFLLGQLYEKSGDKKQAAEEYRAALTSAQGFRPAQDALKRLGA